MLQFLAGTAAIALPNATVPVLAATGICAVVKAVKKKKNDRSKTVRGADSTALFKEVKPVTLEWSCVTCTLSNSEGGEKVLLDNVSGIAKPGRLLALMGPSGSGKTTLLNALAGQLGRAKGLRLRGRIDVNGRPAARRTHRQAFVEQSDNFYSMLTVAETLQVCSQLQLPAELEDGEREAYVDRLVALLGLSKVSQTRVGDEKNRGLSGGEKKRLSIGCELISSPSLIFLDEPTTGLDSFQAEKVVQTLKALADAGHTVVCSIHQPRSSIFALFDDLALLSEGRQLYAGPAAASLAHFASLGHACPEHYNPAEFIADLISIDHSSPALEEETKGRLDSLAAVWRQHSADNSSVASLPARSATPGVEGEKGDEGEEELVPRAPWHVQLRLLLKRSWRQVTRDRSAMMARVSSNLSSAAVFGAIFFRMGRNQASIQDRMGLLQVTAVATAMTALIKTVSVFPSERLVVNRERAKRSYNVAPYLAAKLAAELPISAVYPLLFGAIVYPITGLNPNPLRFMRFLGIIALESFSSAAMGLAVGAMAPSTEAAMALAPAVMLVWIVFGGYYVNAENVPLPLRWLPKASLIKRSFEALCINEFRGLSFKPDAKGHGMRSGQEVLDWLSFSDTSISAAVAAQARILGFYYWATYAILRASRPRSTPLEPPQPPRPPALTSGAAAAAGAGPAPTVAAAHEERSAPTAGGGAAERATA